jgi:RNA polymerase sigma-70 factor (ECF subfamily)
MTPRPFASGPQGPQLRLVPAGVQQPAMDDEDLIGALRQGSVAAGTELYDRLFPVVDCTLVRILGRREQDHADLIQSTFEQVVSSVMKGSYARGCSLARWASVIACHVGLNALRSRRRERGVVDRERGLDELETRERARSTPPEGQLGARADLEAVRGHLADMDPTRVVALLLNAMGCDLAEIAQLTSTSIAAAQSRLSRGRRELRARLEQSPRPGTLYPRVKGLR